MIWVWKIWFLLFKYFIFSSTFNMNILTSTTRLGEFTNEVFSPTGIQYRGTSNIESIKKHLTPKIIRIFVVHKNQDAAQVFSHQYPYFIIILLWKNSISLKSYDKKCSLVTYYVNLSASSMLTFSIKRQIKAI